jgi:hypothetical protein
MERCMSSDGHAWQTDQLTLQAIWPLGYAAYARHHAVPAPGGRAVWAILACRTALVGGQVQACPDGHVERIGYNAWRQRLCPPCAGVQVDRWWTTQQARLLVCAPDHVICTLPPELNDRWLAHIEGMSQLLVSRVHHTVWALRGDGH